MSARTRILLVEDEDIVAMLTEDMLAALGYDVAEVAATFEAGLHAATHGDFDLAA